jgi:hypothetical protein
MNRRAWFCISGVLGDLLLAELCWLFTRESDHSIVFMISEVCDWAAQSDYLSDIL